MMDTGIGKAAVVAVLLFVALGLASPRDAAAQQTVHYLVGAGVNADAGWRTSGPHLFGAALVGWPSSRARGRLEAMTGILESGLTTSANLQVDLLDDTRLTPYILGGVGLPVFDPVGLSGNLGVGVLTRPRGVPLFLEARVTMPQGRGGGFLGVSLGTLF